MDITCTMYVQMNIAILITNILKHVHVRKLWYFVKYIIGKLVYDDCPERETRVTFFCVFKFCIGSVFVLWLILMIVYTSPYSYVWYDVIPRCHVHVQDSRTMYY